MSPLFGGNKGNDDPGPRSAAEREAARLERERRRAERAGRPLPEGPVEPAAPVAPEPAEAPPAPAEPEPFSWDPAPEQPAYEAPVEPEPVAYEPEPAAYEPEPAAYEPEPVDDEAEPYEPGAPAYDEPEPSYEQPYEPEAPAYDEPAPFEPEAPAYEQTVHEPATQAHEAAYVPEPVYEPVTVPPSDEQPAGVVRRAPAPSVRDLPEVAGPTARGPKAPKGAGRGVPRGRPGRRVIPLLLLVLVLAVGWFAFRVFQPFAGDGDTGKPVAVVIAQGATASEIADQLADEGIIDSAFFFNIRSRVSGRRGDLKAGRFTLRRDMSYSAVLDALSKNPAAAPTVKVAMPEGRSIREAAAAVRQSSLTGSYIKAATRNPREVKGLKRYGVPRGTRSLEGFLFPATYELRRSKATSKQLVAEQLATFRSTYDKLDRRAAKRRNLTDYDVLIIASMIEREALVAKDRRLISAVVYNRLKQHIPLGIDATLRYSLNNWSRPLKMSELQKDSAFNTRTRQGLPPTPIGSPGLASIKAALNPAKVGYIFYVVKPCGKGAHAFSSTNAEFEKDVAAYNKKRDQLGGKDPSNC